MDTVTDCSFGNMVRRSVWHPLSTHSQEAAFTYGGKRYTVEIVRYFDPAKDRTTGNRVWYAVNVTSSRGRHCPALSETLRSAFLIGFKSNLDKYIAEGNN